MVNIILINTNMYEGTMIGLIDYISNRNLQQSYL